MKQRTLILILCCGMTTCFQPLLANKELTSPMYNENEDYISSFGSKNYQQPAILRFFRRSLQTGSSYQPCR